MRLHIILASTTLICGCGFRGLPDKMDKTSAGVQDMNGKMDRTNGGLDELNGKLDGTNGGLGQTNEQLGQTNEQLGQTNTQIGDMSAKLDQTNTGLAGVSDQLDETNDGVDALADEVGTTNDQLSSTNSSLLTLLDEMRETSDGLNQMNGQMAVTSAAIHNQVLLLSLQEMTKPENTIVLFPPIGMMPAGRKFALEAGGEEVLELTHAWLGEIEHADLDLDSLRLTGYTEEDLNTMKKSLEHTKQMKLAGLQVIAGFMPIERVEEIARHVETHGRYQRAGLAALMLRTAFVSMILIDAGLFSERLTLHGQMVEAVRLVAELDYLGRLPFARRIGLTSEPTGDLRFDPKPLLTRYYQELDRRFDTDLDPAYFAPEQADADRRRQGAELAALRQKIRENLAHWEAFQPTPVF